MNGDLVLLYLLFLFRRNEDNLRLFNSLVRKFFDKLVFVIIFFVFYVVNENVVN